MPLLNERELAKKLMNQYVNSSTRNWRIVLDVIQEFMIEALDDGDKVRLGIGIFEIRNRKARMGRNPVTGEPVEIPAKRMVKFKPSSSLLRRLNDQE